MEGLYIEMARGGQIRFTLVGDDNLVHKVLSSRFLRSGENQQFGLCVYDQLMITVQI